MSHVTTNDPCRKKYLADAIEFAQNEIEYKFATWNQGNIDGGIPEGMGWADYTFKTEYYALLQAFVAKDSDPLESLRENLHSEKEPATRLQLIIHHTWQLDELLDGFKGSGILRLSLYPEIALLLLNDPDISKEFKDLATLATPHLCGENEEHSVYDFLKTYELVAYAEPIARAGKKRWVAKLTKIYNDLSAREKKPFLDAVCKAAGKRSEILLRELGLTPNEQSETQLDEVAVKTLDTACERMRQIVTTTPKGWTGHAHKLWQACLKRYSVVELQTLAKVFDEIGNKDKRTNLVKALLEINGQKMSKLAVHLRNTYLSTEKAAKHASQVGKKKRKKKNKRVEIDVFAQFKTTDVKEVSLQQELSLKLIPTEGHLRLIDVPKQPANRLCELLQLCELDAKRRVVVLDAIQPHVDTKTLTPVLATTIGRALIHLDDKTFKSYAELTRTIVRSLKEDAGLQAALRWRNRPTLEGLSRTATSLEKSPHASLCAPLLYSYVEAQLGQAKNGQVEKLAEATEALLSCGMSPPKEAVDRQALSIHVWSLTGKKEWVNKSVILWDSGTPEVKERTIESVLRGIVASDDPAHRREYLLTIVQSPQFRALKNRETFARELIFSLLKTPDSEDVQVASTLLEGVTMRETELDEMYAETATQVFNAISNIRNLEERLTYARGFMIAVQTHLPWEERKAWHEQHLSWLTPTTEFSTFSETLRYMPREKCLLEPMQALYEQCVQGNSSIEHRLLLAARLMTMGEERPNGIEEQYNALLHDCWLLETLTSVSLSKPLDAKWNGKDEDYAGPLPDLKRQLEASIAATVMMRKLRSENPEREKVTDDMLKLLKHIDHSDGQILIAFNQLCSDLIKNDPSKKTISRIGELLQAAAKAEVYFGQPDGTVLTCSNLLIVLHRKHPKLVPNLWKEILLHSGLDRAYLGVIANNWTNHLESKDKQIFAKVFLVTAQVAASIEHNQQSGALVAIAAEMWAKAARRGQLLAPKEACAWFLSAAKIIVEKKGAVTNSFYVTATVLAATYDSLPNSPIPTFLEKLCEAVRYEPLPGFKAAIRKSGFTSIEDIDHPLYPIRTALSASKTVKWSQLDGFSDQEIALHLIIPLSIKLSEANTRALSQLIAKRAKCLQHLPKKYGNQPWRAQMYACLCSLAALDDPYCTAAAILAFDFPLHPGHRDIDMMQSFWRIAYASITRAASKKQSMSRKALQHLAELGLQHLGKAEQEKSRELLAALPLETFRYVEHKSAKSEAEIELLQLAAALETISPEKACQALNAFSIGLMGANTAPRFSAESFRICFLAMLSTIERILNLKDPPKEVRNLTDCATYLTQLAGESKKLVDPLSSDERKRLWSISIRTYALSSTPAHIGIACGLFKSQLHTTDRMTVTDLLAALSTADQPHLHQRQFQLVLRGALQQQVITTKEARQLLKYNNTQTRAETTLWTLEHLGMTDQKLFTQSLLILIKNANTCTAESFHRLLAWLQQDQKPEAMAQRLLKTVTDPARRELLSYFKKGELEELKSQENSPLVEQLITRIRCGLSPLDPDIILQLPPLELMDHLAAQGNSKLFDEVLDRCKDKQLQEDITYLRKLVIKAQKD